MSGVAAPPTCAPAMRAPSLPELVQRFGSPLFVYDGEAVVRRADELRAALPDFVDVCFAVKANPSLGILALLRSRGLGAEVASAGELAAARAAGFEAGRILYAGPGKRDAELEAAVAAGVRAIHVESEGELLRLDAIGRRLGRRVRAGLRAHVTWSASEERPIIGGGMPTKFGIPPDEIRARLADWLRLEGVALSGLHVFTATNVRDADAWLACAEHTLELARELAQAGLRLDWVDVGGGLGVPYAEGETPLDLARLGSGLTELGRAARADLAPGLRLVVEPGRYLVAPAGRFLLRVLDRKSCDGVEFLVTDGGVHQLLRPALVGQPHPVHAVKGGARERTYRVVGPLCTSLDSFGDHALPVCEPGDLLAIEHTGAYGFSESMPAFLSHPVPAEVLLWRGEAWLLRARREPTRHLEGQAIPAPLLDGS